MTSHSPEEKNEVVKFLQAHPLGVLSTTNAQFSPEGSVIYFFIDPDATCFFITKAQTRKYQNLLCHPQANLVSYDEERLTAVEVEGSVETIGDSIQAAQVIEKFQDLITATKAGYWIPPVSQLEAGEYVVCKLTPQIIRLSYFDANEGKAQIKLLTF